MALRLVEESRAGIEARRPVLYAILLALSITAPLPVSALQLTSDECLYYAIWTRDLIWAREMGADKEKVRQFFLTDQHNRVFFKLLLKDLDSFWAIPYDENEGWIIANGAYLDCTQRMGKYPDVT